MLAEDELRTTLASAAPASVLIVGGHETRRGELAALVRAAGCFVVDVEVEDALPALRYAKFSVLLVVPEVDASARDAIADAFREALRGRVEEFQEVDGLLVASRVEGPVPRH